MNGSVKILVLVSIFGALALSGYSFYFRLDKFYSDKLTPIYYDAMDKHIGGEYETFLSKKTEKIEADMRKDGYNGVQIDAIRNEAHERAFKLKTWARGGPCPSGEKYVWEPGRLIFYESYS